MPAKQVQLQLVQKILLNYANGTHGTWHDDTEQLKQLLPEMEAAQAVIAACDAGKVAPHHGAILLGLIRHPIGYAKAKEIMLSKALCADYFGACALAQINPVAAYEDLLQLLNTLKSATTRGQIANGLWLTGFPQSWDDLLDLTLRKRLSLAQGADALWGCSSTTQQLGALLNSADVVQQELGIRIAAKQITSNSLAQELRPRILQLLQSPALTIGAKMRKQFECPAKKKR